MAIYFIHGLGSVPNTSTGLRFDAVTGITSTKLSYNAAGTWEENWLSLSSQTRNVTSDDIFVGESMGGFFAAQLAAYYDAKFYGWNPVVAPEFQIMQFVGDFVIEDGTHVTITKEAVLSYMRARDVRNLLSASAVGLVLCRNDTVLDYKLAETYYSKRLLFVDYTTDGHQLNQTTTFIIAGSRALAWLPLQGYPIIHTAKS